MPRSIHVSLPSELTPRVIERLAAIDGVVGVSLQPQASLRPEGDVIQLHVTNPASRAVLAELAALDGSDRISVSTSEIKALVSLSDQSKIDAENSEAAFEEMNTHLRKEANPTLNYFALMALSGVVAAVGLWQDRVHLVIGAMVITPGFEPIMRIPMGLVAGPARMAVRSLGPILGGYAALAAFAGLTYAALRGLYPEIPAALEGRALARYWSTVSGASLLVSLAAGMAGAFALASLRQVVFPGVMIALALVPAAALIGMGLAMGDAVMVGRALLSWLVEVAMVFLGGLVVLGAKRALQHRRKAAG